MIELEFLEYESCILEGEFLIEIWKFFPLYKIRSREYCLTSQLIIDDRGFSLWIFSRAHLNNSVILNTIFVIEIFVWKNVVSELFLNYIMVILNIGN